MSNNLTIHPLKRKKQALSEEEITRIVTEATYGVLAISSDDEPYAVPLNHVYIPETRTFYFHGACFGHKLEVLRENPRASFCVVEKHEVLPDLFATAYRSVIAFGTVSIIEGKDAHDELYALGDRFNPGAHDAIERDIESDAARGVVYKLEVQHMTGKQARSLVE